MGNSLISITKGFEKQITEELTLRVAETEAEGDELAEFNAKIHGKELEEYVKRIFYDHPDNDKILWFYIRHMEKHQIVAGLTLLPLEWKVRLHTFKVAEMGFVGTSPEYRGQGLFGILNDYFEIAVKERNFVLSALVGIPNFYRKHGYEFALERLAGFKMPTSNIPNDQIDDIKIRKASEDDLDLIEKFYSLYHQKYTVSTSFDTEKFNFRFMSGTSDIFRSITYIVDEEREAQGFFTIGSLQDPQRADILMVSDLTQRQMIKVLQFVKTYNMGNIASFRVNITPETDFGQFLEDKGADPVEGWAWQVHIPDLLLFFETYKPVIEERIEESIFKGLTKQIKISDYSQTIQIDIVDGKIEDISTKKEFPSSEFDLRVPPPFSTKLFLSDRSIEEINFIITDAIANPESKGLVKTLFPKQKSIPISYYE